MTTAKNPVIRRLTCGSYAGYQAHRKANELVCDFCRDARNAWERNRRAARKQAADRATLNDTQRAELIASFKVDSTFALELVEQIIADRLLRYT